MSELDRKRDLARAIAESVAERLGKLHDARTVLPDAVDLLRVLLIIDDIERRGNDG